MVERCMQLRITAFAGALALVFLLPACGGGGSGVAVSTQLGLATQSASQEVPEQVLRREGYRIERSDGPPNVQVRTEWRYRSPLPDEGELGVTEVRTRIIVEGRQRGSDIQQIALFNMRMRVQNEGRSESGGDFTNLDATEDFTDYVGAIAQEIRDRYEMGIRME